MAKKAVVRSVESMPNSKTLRPEDCGEERVAGDVGTGKRGSGHSGPSPPWSGC